MTNLKQHPDFSALVAAERTRRRLVRRSGGKAALRANSDLCLRLEQQIMRETGISFAALTSTVLAEV